MRKIILFLLIPFLGTAQNHCETLFHKYNPTNSTLKTTVLVINDLSKNCVDDEFSSDEKATSRSSNNNDLLSTTDNGMVTRSEETVNHSISRARILVEETKRKNNELIRIQEENEAYYDKVEYWGGSSGGVLAGAGLTGGCGAAAAAAGAPTGGAGAVLVGGACLLGGGLLGNEVGNGTAKMATDSYREGSTEETRKNIQNNVKVLVGDLKAKGFPVDDCQTTECVEKIIADSDLSPAEKKVAAYIVKEVIDQTGLNNIPPNIATKEDIDRARMDIGREARKTRRKMEKNHIEVMTATNELSKDIEEMAQNLAEFQEETRQNHLKMNNKLNSLLENDEIIIGELNEHRALLEQNSVDNAIMTDILIGQLGNSQQAAFYDLCLSGKEGCPSGLKKSLEADRDAFEKRKERLEKIAKTEKFIAQAQRISEALDAGFDIAVQLGLKGSAQEAVAKGMTYAKAGLAIGTGIARIATGDILGGAMAAIKGISGLFGGGESAPSEVMLLQEEMNQKFDIVDAKLDTIMSLQIRLHKDLSKNIKANRELMQYRFNNVDYQLAEIIDNQNVIQSKLKALLNDEVKNCYTVYNLARNEPQIDIGELSNYQNYVDLYNVNGSACGDCLKGIRSWLNDTGLDIENSNIEFTNFAITRGESEYVDSEIDTYKKMTAFFKWYYGTKLNNLDKALQLLLIPTKNIDENLDIYCELRNDNFNYKLTFDEALNSIYYLDPYSFRDFVTIYSIFYPYFEFQKLEANTGDYQPLSLESFIDFSINEQSILALRKKSIKNHIEKLFHVSQTIKAQQSLMSGHMLIQPFYYILYQDQYNSNEFIKFGEDNNLFSPKQLAIDILANNPTMAQNFAAFAIRKNYRMNEFIYKASFDGKPINPNYDQFVNYAYDNTNPRVFVTGVDSFYIDETTFLGVDEEILEANSYIDNLDFEKRTLSSGNDFALLHLEVSGNQCRTNDFVTCETFIPVPEKGTLESNSFGFTGGYQFAGETEQMLNNLTDEVKFSDGFRDNWMELTQIKLAILNDAN